MRLMVVAQSDRCHILNIGQRMTAPCKKNKNNLSKTPFHISIGPYAQDQKEIVLYLKEITLGENHYNSGIRMEIY